MNSPREVSAEVRAFLRDKVTSYEELEALLLLRRRRNETFSSGSASDIVGVPEEAVAEALDNLCRQGLLVDVQVSPKSRIFRYSPGDSSLAEVIDQLAEEYESNRVEVMKLMTSNAIDRVRSKAMHMFADSFIVGKGTKKNG